MEESDEDKSLPHHKNQKELVPLSKLAGTHLCFSGEEYVLGSLKLGFMLFYFIFFKIRP